VGVGVGVSVGVSVEVGVSVGVGVADHVAVGVGVADHVAVGVGVADHVAVGVGVAVHVGVGVGVSVAVGVGVGVSVAVAVGVGVASWRQILPEDTRHPGKNCRPIKFPSQFVFDPCVQQYWPSAHLVAHEGCESVHSLWAAGIWQMSFSLRHEVPSAESAQEWVSLQQNCPASHPPIPPKNVPPHPMSLAIPVEPHVRVIVA
jgi:hypothetical protein